jgi:hypothetical protein
MVAALPLDKDATIFLGEKASLSARFNVDILTNKRFPALA